MKHLLSSVVLALGSTLLYCNTASAILITRNAGADSLGSAATVTSATVDEVAGTIDISLSVLELGSPFSLGFDITSEVNASVVSPETEAYVVNVSLTNAIPRPGLGRPISGFDLQVDAPIGTPNAFLDPPPATSDRFAVETPNLPTGFRFGGLNGGGGEIYFGETAISSIGLTAFNFGAAGVTRSISLQFTANPEPASMALAACVLGPAGVVIQRRRRQRMKVAAAAP